MFAVEVQCSFNAAHALRTADGRSEPMHTHEFCVTARVSAPSIDRSGMLLDFHVLRDLLESIVGPWRGRSLNDLEPFASQVNPSAERIAEHIGRRLGEAVVRLDAARPGRVTRVRVTEAPGCVAIWSSE